MNKAKEYLELKGLDQTYWGSIIVWAEERGSFTTRSKEQAGSWVTCACGRVTSDIPRYELQSRPQDRLLNNLGGRFYGAVEENDFLAAAQTLVRIEARAIIVAKAHLQEQTA
tara:strand:- start:348 stop:683 length:336 start_codon:yes stop_codon:yes gene_type:complete